jgi:mRNA-degrading endonuclease RelE of RelBE toxin-antitoxin system
MQRPFAIERIIHDLSQCLPNAFDTAEPGRPAIRLLPSSRNVISNDRSGDPADVIVAGESAGIDPSMDIEIEGEISNTGLDALAWYRSFHYGPKDWGIYFREDGLYFVAHRVLGAIPGMDFPYRVQLAFRLLLRHEYFHFLTDLAATFLELEQGQHVYLTYRREHQPWNDLEEALANAYAQRGKFPVGIRACFQAFMKRQPSGYRDFERYRAPGNFIDAVQELGAQLTDNPLPVIRELLFDFDGTVAVPWDIPFYVVPRARARPGTLYFCTSIPHTRTTEAFNRDLGKLPGDIQRRVAKAVEILKSTTQHRGLKFEKLKNCDTVFSCRVSGGYRITLRPSDQTWELLRVGKHDDVYRAPV